MSKRKKTATPAATLPNPSMFMQKVPQVFPVALLIDGENVMVPDLLAYILVEAGKLGGVTTRQVYGNWALPSMQVWKKQFSHYGLELMGNRSGPNATDIALVIGAMDLLYRGVRHFCLVAGDSDYVPLVERLRRDGCVVLVIGGPAVSNALKNVSTAFLSTEQLVPQKVPAASPAASSPSQKQAAWETQSLIVLLTGAYQLAAQQSGLEWIPLAALGTILRQQNPTFEEIYGKKKLSALVKEAAGCLETRRVEKGKGLVEEVRLCLSPQG